MQGFRFIKCSEVQRRAHSSAVQVTATTQPGGRVSAQYQEPIHF